MFEPLIFPTVATLKVGKFQSFLSFSFLASSILFTWIQGIWILIWIWIWRKKRFWERNEFWGVMVVLHGKRTDFLVLGRNKNGVCFYFCCWGS